MSNGNVDNVRRLQDKGDKELDDPSDNEISISMSGLSKNDVNPMINDAIKQLKQENAITLAALKAEFKGQVDILKELVVAKEGEINKLNRELGELKSSIEVTDQKVDTNELAISDSKTDIEKCLDDINFIDNRSAELEDRSMRQNLVFFGFAEKDGETNEDCEKLLQELIAEKKMLTSNGSNVRFDRVHRLGKPDKEKKRPRPIVCRFTYYKDKETVLSNARNLKGLNVRVSEQYSKITNEMHSKIFQECKRAKDLPNSPIEKFFVKYRYAVIYSKSGMRRNVNLRALENPGWLRGFQ